MNKIVYYKIMTDKQDKEMTAHLGEQQIGHFQRQAAVILYMCCLKRENIEDLQTSTYND